MIYLEKSLSCTIYSRKIAVYFQTDMNRTTLPVKWIIYGLDSNIYLECFLGFLFDNCKEVKQYNSLYSNAEAVQSHVCRCQHMIFSDNPAIYMHEYALEIFGHCSPLIFFLVGSTSQ